jgi:hypothetical protein
MRMIKRVLPGLRRSEAPATHRMHREVRRSSCFASLRLGANVLLFFRRARTTVTDIVA